HTAGEVAGWVVRGRSAAAAASHVLIWGAWVPGRDLSKRRVNIPCEILNLHHRAVERVVIRTADDPSLVYGGDGITGCIIDCPVDHVFVRLAAWRIIR